MNEKPQAILNALLFAVLCLASVAVMAGLVRLILDIVGII